jgi:hypothetical protein
MFALALATTAADGVSAASLAAPLGVAAPFTFNFDGAPATPQPWNPPNWDVAVNSGNVNTFAQLEGMQAQHGSDCSPYPATHFNNTYEGAVFLCHNHVMTAINAGGYGEIVLTPDHLVDFSGGEATIRFNLSTLRTSLRDWVGVWITPFEDNLVLPVDPFLHVGEQGPPQRGIELKMDSANGGTIFKATVMDGFKGTVLKVNTSKTLEKLLGPSAVTRTTFELRISKTHLTFGAPTLGYNWVDTPLIGLSWTRGVVQLSHHSYNPTKHDGCGPKVTPCLPDTWHWSSFYISSAVPFTLLRGNIQVVHAGTGAVITFPAAAPKSAFLRFSGIGKIDVSLDGGKTWQAAQRQVQRDDFVEHFSSYWTPIRAGTSSVTLRGQRFYGGPWYVRDIAIWSASAPASSGAQGPAAPPNASKPVLHPATAKPATGLVALFARPAVAATIAVIAVALLGGLAYLAMLRRRRIRLERR